MSKILLGIVIATVSGALAAGQPLFRTLASPAAARVSSGHGGSGPGGSEHSGGSDSGRSGSSERGRDDRSGEAEPGDDRGGQGEAEPGDDHGTDAGTSTDPLATVVVPAVSK